MIHLQDWLSAQRWADGINIWPSAVGTFNRPSACVQVYKKFVWVLSGFIEILIKNIFKNLKTQKKIKSWSGGYTTSLQNQKRKLMSSKGAALNKNVISYHVFDEERNSQSVSQSVSQSEYIQFKITFKHPNGHIATILIDQKQVTSFCFGDISKYLKLKNAPEILASRLRLRLFYLTSQ